MKANHFSFDTALNRGDEEMEVRVIYEVSPFIPARGPTYACGGQPAEGGEVEIILVTYNGKVLWMLPAVEAQIQAECEERAEQDMADEAAAEADWRYQEHRDRQLMERWEREHD